MALRSAVFLGLLVLLLVGISVAAGPASEIQSALENVRDFLCKILPFIAIVAIALAAVVFAAGQLGGAEIRAKTTVWAQNLFIFAIFALIVAIVGPWLITQFYSSSSVTGCS